MPKNPGSMTRAEVENLYKKYAPFVLRRARSILGDAAMAHDVTQDLFAELVKGTDGFKGQSSVMTWLYQATTHRCLNVLRDAKTRAKLLARPAAEPSSAGPAHDRVLVRELLAEVPDDLREIAVYYFVDQLDQEEIAALMNVSRRTIGNRREEFKALVKARS